jgi:hypothetical protein
VTKRPTLSIIVPTVIGRDHWLGRCLTAYRETTRVRYETIVLRDRLTCGVAWQEGGDQAKGDYLHFTADDLEPHPGWWQAAKACADSGQLPCPRVLNSDGSLQSCGEWGQEMEEGTATYIARVPFLSREQWNLGGWILPGVQYFGDNWFAVRGKQLGIPTVVCRGMTFTHHYAPEGRHGNERMQADHETFKRACAVAE